jgi:hypothetical protein
VAKAPVWSIGVAQRDAQAALGVKRVVSGPRMNGVGRFGELVRSVVGVGVAIYILAGMVAAYGLSTRCYRVVTVNIQESEYRHHCKSAVTIYTYPLT